MLNSHGKRFYLGSKISRLGNILKKTTTTRINDYKKRLSNADAFYEPLLKNLIIDDFSKFDACEMRPSSGN